MAAFSQRRKRRSIIKAEAELFHTMRNVAVMPLEDGSMPLAFADNKFGDYVNSPQFPGCLWVMERRIVHGALANLRIVRYNGRLL